MGIITAKEPRPINRGFLLQYSKTCRLKNGMTVTLRAITPADEELMIAFHKTLSESTVYHRYLQILKLSRRIAHSRLVKMCFNDYAHEVVMVAETSGGSVGHEEGRDRRILGVGRLSRNLERNDAEIAIVLSDQCQGFGLGTELTRMLHEVALAEGIGKIHACLLRDNLAMYRILRRFGYDVEDNLSDDMIYAEKILSPTANV